MARAHPFVRLLMLPLFSASAAAGGEWITFSDQTAARLVADAAVGVADAQEKDYAWGDLDQDGDVDLVCVRKQPWNTPGRFRNVLFMNEGPAEGHAVGGVLVDRTLDLASNADDGGQGLLDLTADRDVALVDVDGDGWLDIVTSTTYGEELPKTISHPRVYLNLGRSAGIWQGFRYEEARTPQMPTTPHFCGVGFGDVTGDDRPDLYFVDYNGGLEDRLWINDGTGHFNDQTVVRMTFEMVESDFGVHAVIADINGDGVNDIVKDRGSTTTTPPLRVSTTYNDPDDEGVFDIFNIFYNGNPYHVDVGELNNDGLLDIVVEDDGSDRYFLNQGNGGDTVADFLSFTFAPGPDSFGGNIHIRDLDGDGFNDVLIADVDVDCCGCSRHMRFWRNQANLPVVTFQEETLGIPIAARTGTHDVAVFDVNGDEALDLVIGTCTGTSVWIQDVPLADLDFDYPQGLPAMVDPGAATPVFVEITASGDPIDSGSATLHVSVNGGPFNTMPMTGRGAGLFEAALPPAACLDRLHFYISAQAPGGSDVDPPAAPREAHRAVATFGTSVVFRDDVEGGVSGWTVSNDRSLASGAWQQARPVGSHSGSDPAAPDQDGEAGPLHVLAFVTGNGDADDDASVADVDGGATRLTSPAIDLGGGDARVSCAVWFYSSEAGTPGAEDLLSAEVSGDDGATWTVVESIAGTGGAWQGLSFLVGDHVAASGPVRVRFSVADDLAEPGASIVEAGVDAFEVALLRCAPCAVAADCDNGLYCDGSESCAGNGHCTVGAAPCPGQLCDDGAAACVACLHDAHCEDGSFCNGTESCAAGGSCLAGADPCPGQPCDEIANLCAACAADGDCDDGLFCNGQEACLGGQCTPGTLPCPGQPCDERAGACLVAVTLQPRMGEPLAGLSPAELARFIVGRTAFNQPFDENAGLGPTFNQISCGACHNTPLGGSGTITVTRFGVIDLKTGAFDPLEALGGSLLQAQAIDDACLEQVPPQANVVTTRATASTLGFGLIEAIPDDALADLAKNPPSPAVSGRLHLVEPLEAPGTLRAGRFGWKAQVATVLSFSADAALNEMGITSDLVPVENAPNGDTGLLAACDAVADPEDSGPAGTRFIDQVTDFQRFSAAPPQTPRGGMSGEAFFAVIGCTLCHVPSYVTLGDAGLEPALRSRLIHPYSDFLLHDMGILFDGIAQGAAAPAEIRTPPLWGLRVRDPLLHDASVGGDTFAGRVTEAILRHGGIGSEAQACVEAFSVLPPAGKADVIAFLDSLGRAEFDHDGNNVIDMDDFVSFMACAGNPGRPFAPDDPCAGSDVDQDGDIDADDFDLFLEAFDGPPPDCNTTGVSDLVEIFGGATPDCNGNGQPDECDLQSGEVLQWAATVIDFSSEYNLSPPNFLAIQALGPPDTFTYGANGTTWSPLPPNGTTEYITLGYDEPVFSTGVTVRETEGNGYVYRVDVTDTGGDNHTVWTGSDPSQPGTPVNFLITWPQTPYTVQAVTIYTDTNADLSTWESIDAVQLHGVGLGSSLDTNLNDIPDECEVCTATAGCADTDGDGRRDDPCMWWTCTAGFCAGTAIPWADMGGAFGACPPDGTADANDRFHALNCFSNTNSAGQAGYPCEPAAPQALNVDAGGPFGSCVPDGVCDGHDAFHALNAFNGLTACSCAGAPAPVAGGPDPKPGSPVAGAPAPKNGQAGPQPRVVERTSVRLEPSTTTVAAGDTIDVAIFLADELADLRGYQLHLGVSGGDRGRLELVDLLIDAREDHVFAGLPYWNGFNLHTRQLLAGLDSAGVATAERRYLATAVLRATTDAAGTFAVHLLHDAQNPSHRTFLFPTPPGRMIAVEESTPAVVTVAGLQRRSTPGPTTELQDRGSVP